MGKSSSSTIKSIIREELFHHILKEADRVKGSGARGMPGWKSSAQNQRRLLQIGHQINIQIKANLDEKEFIDKVSEKLENMIDKKAFKNTPGGLNSWKINLKKMLKERSGTSGEFNQYISGNLTKVAAAIKFGAGSQKDIDQVIGQYIDLLETNYSLSDFSAAVVQAKTAKCPAGKMYKDGECIEIKSLQGDKVGDISRSGQEAEEQGRAEGEPGRGVGASFKPMPPELRGRPELIDKPMSDPEVAALLIKFVSTADRAIASAKKAATQRIASQTFADGVKSDLEIGSGDLYIEGTFERFMESWIPNATKMINDMVVYYGRDTILSFANGDTTCYDRGPLRENRSFKDIVSYLLNEQPRPATSGGPANSRKKHQCMLSDLGENIIDNVPLVILFGVRDKHFDPDSNNYGTNFGTGMTLNSSRWIKKLLNGDKRLSSIGEHINEVARHEIGHLITLLVYYGGGTIAGTLAGEAREGKQIDHSWDESLQKKLSNSIMATAMRQKWTSADVAKTGDNRLNRLSSFIDLRIWPTGDAAQDAVNAKVAYDIGKMRGTEWGPDGSVDNRTVDLTDDGKYMFLTQGPLMPGATPSQKNKTDRGTGTSTSVLIYLDPRAARTRTEMEVRVISAKRQLKIDGKKRGFSGQYDITLDDLKKLSSTKYSTLVSWFGPQTADIASFLKIPEELDADSVAAFNGVIAKASTGKESGEATAIAEKTVRLLIRKSLLKELLIRKRNQG